MKQQKNAAVPVRDRLHVLVSSERLKQIKELLSNDPNAKGLINEPAGVFGYTTLHEAVSARRADILRLLLAYGGNVDVLSNGRYTPLHIAASIGDVDCIKVLLEFGASLSLTDEFGKNPLGTAQLNRRSKAAKVLRSHEIKKYAAEGHANLRYSIEGLQRGTEIEENCFEEALELAVGNNRGKAAGYLVLHGARNLERCMQAALLKPPLHKTAVLLLLCHAAKINDKELVKVICTGLFKENQKVGIVMKNDNVFTRNYLPKEWSNSMSRQKLNQLRAAVRPMDMAFPVSIAFGLAHYEVTKIFLFEIFCKEKEAEADWHGLALSRLLPDWIRGIIGYKKLILSHNSLNSFPREIVGMQHLSTLNLTKNSIEEDLPKEIFELRHLRSLNLSFNQIHYLPKVDEWSKSLKILNLKGNKLRFVDYSIADSELEDLNLAQNELSAVQPCICDIKTLQVLDLSKNKKITVLPPDLAKLSNLNVLGLEQMEQITDPPPALRAPTSVLLSHLRARLRNSEPYYTMKLMIVGLANRGKTTLMHRINRDFSFSKNNSTQGIDIREIAIQNFSFKCWDFAGQEEYYATHQCFLSQRSLYLLVWNVEDGDEGIAGLKPWLDNLQFRVPLSSVIIVGTHLDKISAAKRAEGFEKEMTDKVNDLVSQYNKIICQIELITITTCCVEKEYLDECRRRSEKLRGLIYSVAQLMTIDGKRNSPRVMGEKIPSSYLTLAKMVDEKRAELEAKQSLPLLRRCQFQDLVEENATKHPQDYFDPEDIDIATEFLHNIGIILHYDDPNQDLRDLYFISPSWLCDLMAKVVTIREAHNFIRDGILFERDIPFIIDENRRFPREFYPKYLRLLARFQIACRIDKERVLLPSQLPLKNPHEDGNFQEPYQTLRRIHSFSCIPNGFWSRFISRFLFYLKDMLLVSQDGIEKNRMDDTFEEESKSKFDATEISDRGSIPSWVDSKRSGEEEAEISAEVDGAVSQSNKERKKTVQNDMAANPEVRADDSKRVGEEVLAETSVDVSEKDHGTRRGVEAQNDVAADAKMDSYAAKNADVHRDSTADLVGTVQEKAVINGVEDLNEIKSQNKTLTNEYENSANVCYDPASHTTEPPFSLNGFLFEMEEGNRSDTQSPKNGNQSSRDATPVSLGDDSSVSSQMSASTQGHPGAASSQAVDCDEGPPRANSESDDSLADEALAIPFRVTTEAKDSQPPYQPFHNEARSEDDEDIFDELIDIPFLLSRQYLVCWRNGVLFKHPRLYLSVSLLPSQNGRELIETKVSRSRMGYRALAFIVDHFRTLIKEWFPGLEGTNGSEPHVCQFVPCSICLDYGIKPAHQFDVSECFKESITRDFVFCENVHDPKVVKLGNLCPDLLFMDLDTSLQLNSANLRYMEVDDYLLGVGQFGKVYRGSYEEKPAAIKIYNFKVEENPEGCDALDKFYEIRQEAVVLSRIGCHPNVISFFGVACRPKFCLVIELATQGTLKDVLRSGPIKRIVVYRIAQQIASSITHLHTRGIIHRDLKSDNILIFSLDGHSEINVKIADFGTANFISPVGLKYFTGTPGFIAPEIFEYSKTEEYDETVDVYSYAMVLYELISKRRPFHQAQSALEINSAIKDGKRPIFYDLPNTKVSLFTLTDLMLNCWKQQATKRPKSSEVSRQTKSPSFCLLYGKTPMKNVNTPRLLCFVQSTGEIWVACDDRQGASVLILDMKTSTIKQKFVPEKKTVSKGKELFFNISGIHEIDKQHVAIVLRSTSDYVSIYSAEKKKLVDSYLVSDTYIRSLTVSVDHVILGCEGGSFTVVTKKDFVKGIFKSKVTVPVNENRAIFAITTSKVTDAFGITDTKVLLGCGRYVYKYPFTLLDPFTVNPEMKCANEKHIIYAMHASEDEQMLFLSYNGCPVISVFLIASMQMIDEINCSIEIKRLLPNSDALDQRITTFCVSNDTVWIGMGSGHILIYEIKIGSPPLLITWLKPYKLEVRSIVPCHIPSSEPSHFVATIGKEVNATALSYAESGLCLLTSCFPTDQADPALQRKSSRKSSASPVPKPSENEQFEKKMLLIWESPNAATLKKVVE